MNMKQYSKLRRRDHRIGLHRIVRSVGLSCLLVLLLSLPISAQGNAAAASKGALFASPDVAVEALIVAAEKYDETALLQILGPNSYDIIHTGEPVVDRETVTGFAALAREKMAI